MRILWTVWKPVHRFNLLTLCCPTSTFDLQAQVVSPPFSLTSVPPPSGCLSVPHPYFGSEPSSSRRFSLSTSLSFPLCACCACLSLLCVFVSSLLSAWMLWALPFVCLCAVSPFCDFTVERRSRGSSRSTSWIHILHIKTFQKFGFACHKSLILQGQGTVVYLFMPLGCRGILS